MRILALNDAESSENKIHSNDVAAKYGFAGALVSGANVFGYLTQPLTQACGTGCLEGAEYCVNFRKPAYHNEMLSIKTRTLESESKSSRFFSSAYNPAGDLLAELETRLLQHRPVENQQYCPSDESKTLQRSEIHWDRIQLFEAAPDFHWAPSEESNRQRIEAQRDHNLIYRGPNGLIHPYYLLGACNEALKRMFILPAWIHVGSRLKIRKAIRVGQNIVVQSKATEKWEHKGHQFIRLGIAMFTEEELALEAEHTAIFRIAQ